MFSPSPQQHIAIKDIFKWYNDPKSKQYYYLAGFAGTGKTTVAELIVDLLGLNKDDMKDVVFAAYMGKAALVMRRKGMETATTIHRLIYKPIVDPITKNTIFVLNDESNARYTKLIVVDECSMVDEKIKRDLLSFRTKILVLGDPGQIRPISGYGAFTNSKPDYFLHEIHRQALDNPIIRLSMMAREGKNIPIGRYSDNINVVLASSDDASLEAMLEMNQIITGKNKTRQDLNVAINDFIGHDEENPTIDNLKVICLRNQYDIGIVNGQIMWTSHNDYKFGDKKDNFYRTYYDDYDNQTYGPLKTSNMYFHEYNNYIPDKVREDTIKNRDLSLFDYAWAITGHKSQGSQWNDVCIFDDGFGLWDKQIRSEWMYTNVTRSENGLLIIRV